MDTKWSVLSGLTLLAIIAIVPLAIYEPGDPGLLLWLPDAVTQQARTVDTIFYFLLGLTGLLFIGIHLIMIYFLIVYHQGNRDETADVEGHLGIEVTWTVIPTLIMIFLGVWTYQVYAGLVAPHEQGENLAVDVYAQQFRWQFEYPEAEEPFVTTNTMVVPADQPLTLTFESRDVTHSFWVPAFRIKQDTLPGSNPKLYLDQIEQTGEYPLRCAELCGISHYRMNGTVVVLEPDEFKTWHSMTDRDERQNYLRQVRSNG